VTWVSNPGLRGGGVGSGDEGGGGFIRVTPGESVFEREEGMLEGLWGMEGEGEWDW